MRHLKLKLSLILVACLVTGLAFSTSCTDADASYDDFAAQISSTSGTMDTAETPEFVLPTEIQEEDSILMASVEFGKTAEHELGEYALKTHGQKLDVYTPDGKLAGSFKMDGGKLVPEGKQPMDNQVKATYSGPPGDKYTAFRVYPGNHKTGDGMKPYFEIDHNAGQVTLTPGKDVEFTKYGKSRGTKKDKSGPSGSCGTGGGGGGG